MGKRPPNNEGMELTTIHNDMNLLKKQVEEVLFILGGSVSYDYKGMRSDVKELKSDVILIKDRVEDLETKNKQREKERGLFSIKLETIPSKVVAFVVFLGALLAIVQSIRSLFHQV